VFAVWGEDSITPSECGQDLPLRNYFKVMKLLIAGAAGQLGQALAREAGKQGWEVVATDVAQMDITDLPAVQQHLARHRPEVVVNAAAATRVDDLEAAPDLALKVNGLGPRNLAVACRQLGVKLIHLSTDYVFDGTKDGPYQEWDATNPLSVYGRSKLLGEELVRQQCPDHFIVRTAWLYGLPGPNFVTAILAKGRAGQALQVVNDQRGSPTSALALAPQLLALAATEAFGTYHATCRGEATWYEFALHILSQAGLAVPVTACATAAYSRPAPRPANSVLENRMLGLSGLDLMPSWQEAFQEFWGTCGRQLLA
jgi:dTDP-4-dehydrorhamnose reductase